MIRTVLFCLSFLVGSYPNLSGQQIGYFGGGLNRGMASTSDVIQAVPGTYQLKNDFYRGYSGYFLSYPITEKWNVGIDYTLTEGWTGTSFELDHCSDICGHNSSLIRLHRYGLFAERQLLDWRNIFRISGKAKVMYENAENTWPSLDYGELRKVSSWRPENTGPYTEWDMYVQPLPGKQVLPGIAIRLQVRLIWRLYFHYEYGYTEGHREFQKFYFDNHYLGEPGVTGIWSSDGDLQYRTWGFSVKFLGPMERFEKGKFELF